MCRVSFLLKCASVFNGGGDQAHFFFVQSFHLGFVSRPKRRKSVTCLLQKEKKALVFYKSFGSSGEDKQRQTFHSECSGKKQKIKIIIYIFIKFDSILGFE